MLALVLFVLLSSTAVRSLASPWGPPTQVLVAVAPLPIGTPLDSHVLQLVDWPTHLVPAEALTRAEGTLRAPLPQGAVATEAHVARDAIAAGLLPGTVAVAVPVDALPPLEPSTAVALVTGTPDGGARTVTDRAVVLAADDVTLWLQVPEGDAHHVSAAASVAALGAVVLPRTPSP